MIERTHVVSVYRAGAAPIDPYADPPATRFGMPVRTGLRVSLEPLTGSVQQTAAGRQIDASWRGYANWGIDIRSDDILLVTGVLQEGAGALGERFRVKAAGPQGAPWDLELLLDTTTEVVA